VSNSFSWNLLDVPSETQLSDRLPTGVVVERFALSYILMPFSNYPHRAITAVNLHPDTWNSFMFPYGGLRIDDSEAAGGAETFQQLTAALHGLVARNLDAYLAEAKNELLAYYSDVPNLYETAPVYRNYSLKFSKSADKWTAYIFTYHPCPLTLLAAPGLARGEIPMTAAAVSSAVQTRQLSGVSLEENVVALLQADIMKFWSGSDV